MTDISKNLESAFWDGYIQHQAKAMVEMSEEAGETVDYETTFKEMRELMEELLRERMK